MDSNPSEWMRDQVAEWEQYQTAVEAARQTPATIDENTTIEDSYQFLKDEVTRFRAEVGAVAEYNARVSAEAEEPQPAAGNSLRKVEFMKNDVELFKEGVSKTLMQNHRRTCSTCAKPRAEPTIAPTIAFMEDEVQQFKKNMNM